MEKTPILRKIDICKKCNAFTKNDKSAFAFALFVEGKCMMCLMDSSVEHNGMLFPLMTDNVKEYETYETPETCLFWTEQCMANWNKKSEKKE